MKGNPMSKNTADFMFDNFLLFRVIALILLVVGIATASFSVLIAAGIITYGWPFFYVYLLKSNAGRENAMLLGLTRRVASVLSVPSRIVR
jgi:uncharacterized membrane protein (Fun14 family)